ncbi:MAG: zinc dependent phospholipase C family protein [Fibromonadales bacterium]|nr:zinc dependent phospholipase C family protein [Fibromonadales bacterium]
MDLEKFPLWKMALLANPDSFGVMPANYVPELPQNTAKESKIAKNDEKKAKTTLYYTIIKTELCIDRYLSFSESLATACFRASENKGEKVFLQGNAFLAKLARSVFEKNGNLFADACEAHKGESYFLECAKALEEQGFALVGGELGRSSWLDLYKAVLLLTEEYLCTKGEVTLAQIHVIEENSSDLKIIFVPDGMAWEQVQDAALLPLSPVPCSSDFLAIGAKFFDFLTEKMPNDMVFMEKLYPLPLPNSFITAIMEPNKLGAYKDKKIYISHRLALDSLRNPSSRFLLLLAFLHEYGHFLDDVLHERAGMAGGDSEGEEGEAFANMFMEHYMNEDLKFVNFVAPNPKGEDLRFDIEAKTSEHDEKQRLLDIHFSVMNSVKDAGRLKLPSGETIENAELWGIDVKGGGHEDLTEEAALEVGFKFGGLNGQDLEEGCAWPDVPYAEDIYKTTTAYAHFVWIYRRHTKSGITYEGDLAYESHFGKNQHWHSMCPKEKGKTFTNEEVKTKIIQQLQEWYNDAIKFKEKNGLFHIGKMLHTIQDSYCFSHCWRTFNKYKWSIWTFQGYEKQNSDLHSVADQSFVKNKSGKKIQTIGYKKALEATKFILGCYKENSGWEKLYKYLNDSIYVIHPGRESVIAGESHSWFEKANSSQESQIENQLYELSQKEA